MKRIVISAALLTLAGCGGEMDELKQFVRESEKGLPRRIEPLPPVKPFEPFTYEGFDLPDPFKPRKLQDRKDGPTSALAPDLNRRKEPLEAFPLESIQMLGTITQEKETFALVKAGPNLYRVRKGMYMGQNFGVITGIDEQQINLKELVQDSGGEWVERASTLQLVEARR